MKEHLQILVSNPTIVLGQMSRYGEHLNSKFHQYIPDSGGVSVVDQEWDNLLIFDACRHDYFTDVMSSFDVDGDLKEVRSRGSYTQEWLQENFAGGTFHDTVYVTANPRSIFDLDNRIFHDVIPLFDEEWDDDLKTVPPDRVTERVRIAAEKYPNKRVIGHYVQPHAPYIDSVGREICGHGYSSYKDIEFSEDSYGVWTKARNRIDGVTVNHVRTAYENSLRLAIESSLDLVDELSGKTVLSSDHGELLGERTWPIPVRGFEHPPIKMDILRKVPWFEPPFNSRKQVEAESPIKRDGESGIDDEVINDRLSALGYTEDSTLS